MVGLLWLFLMLSFWHTHTCALVFCLATVWLEKTVENSINGVCESYKWYHHVRNDELRRTTGLS